MEHVFKIDSLYEVELSVFYQGVNNKIVRSAKFFQFNFMKW